MSRAVQECCKVSGFDNRASDFGDLSATRYTGMIEASPSETYSRYDLIAARRQFIVLCIWPPSTADEAVFHGQSGPCYAAEGR